MSSLELTIAKRVTLTEYLLERMRGYVERNRLDGEMYCGEFTNVAVENRWRSAQAGAEWTVEFLSKHYEQKYQDDLAFKAARIAELEEELAKLKGQ